jgi:hypothetical protein
MVTTTVRIPYHLQSHLLTVFLDKLKDLGRAMFSNAHISGGDQISNEHGSSFDSVASAACKSSELSHRLLPEKQW